MSTLNLVFLKPIPGYDKYYASEDGRIFSSQRGDKIQMKGNFVGGYFSVPVIKQKGKKRITDARKIHRLVAFAWIPNPLNLPMVNHKDGNKINNKVSNLEWSTASDNTKHAHATGLIVQTSKRPVCQFDLKHNFIREHESVTAAAAFIGVSIGQICGVCSGKKRSCKGFAWMYKDDYEAGKIIRPNGHNKSIGQYDLKDNFIKEFPSLTDASKEVGVAATNIAEACKGTRQKTSGGYKWKFIDQTVPKPNVVVPIIRTEPAEIKDWVILKQYPGYKISRDGRIYSFFVKRMIKISRIQGQRDCAYIKVLNGKPKSVYIHRLVALAYIDNPKKCPVVNHIDGNCYNNSVENLEWCTYSENTIHAYETGLIKNTMVKITQLTFDNKKIRDHASYAAAARFMKVNTSSLQYAVTNNTIYRGYKWKRA